MKIMKIAASVILLLSLPALAQNRPGLEEHLLSDVRDAGIPIEGAQISPAPSPSGKYLAFTGDNFKGIRLFSLDDGKVRELTNLEGAGFGFEWAPSDDLVAFRGSLGKINKKLLIAVGHPDGTVEVSSALSESLSLPAWKDGLVLFADWKNGSTLKSAGPENGDGFKGIKLPRPSGALVAFDKEMKASRNESGDGRVFFMPRYSQDGKTLLIHCLDGHIYLGKEGSDELRDIGEGSSARFARDGSCIIYEKTLDDGHRIVASDIYLYSISTRMTYRLTDTPDKIEMRPSMAEDGHTVFFDLDGRIMRGWLK